MEIICTLYIDKLRHKLVQTQLCIKYKSLYLVDLMIDRNVWLKHIFDIGL